MPEFPLDFASRHIRRVFARAVGNSIPKILTELITNADDSYRRIVDEAQQAGREPGIENPAPITILFERSKRRFSEDTRLGCKSVVGISTAVFSLE